MTTERYQEAPGQGDPFTNRALSGQYAPGSTFKLITAYAALTTGLITPDTTYNARSSYRVEGCSGESCVFTQPGGPNGPISIQAAITQSSDTFFYWMGDRFWRERGRFGETAIQDAGEAFGLGSPTGIPLPFERSGVMPTPQQRQERHEQNPEAFPNPRWRVGDNINISIGQGEVLVTPLQLANAYATFANGGTLYSPNVAARGAGAEVRPRRPRGRGDPRRRASAVTDDLQIPPSIFQPMMGGFDGVTKSGTAAGVFEGWDHSLWSVGGKTGTAEVNGKDDTSLFVGFGPVSDPQYVTAVIVEQGGFGAETAAPIVRRILEPIANVYPMPPALTIEERLNAPPPPPPAEGEAPAEAQGG
ncbi:MAG: penicillin-binding transpeptidase domain-containing protein [Acidimicrobiia bacterium]|nr:penicillin-binding transpeptidase domain-containing protein [Acidimicrobiia bacterium]